MTERTATSNLKKLRLFCIEQDTSVSEIAREMKKSRQAIYYSLKKPTRFPRTFRKVMKLIGGPNQ